MRRLTCSLLGILIASVLPALPVAAQTAASAKACLLTPDQLGKTLGGSFQPGKEEGDQGAMGNACTYKGKDYTVWVIQTRPAQFGMTTQQLLKLTEPGQFKPLAGDPDNLQFQQPKEGVPPFPSIVYERKGVVVKVRIVGPTSEPIDAVNAKLAKLPRIP